MAYEDYYSTEPNQIWNYNFGSISFGGPSKDKPSYLMTYDDGYGAVSQWVEEGPKMFQFMSGGWKASGYNPGSPKKEKAPEQTGIQTGAGADLKKRILPSDVDAVDRKRRGANYQYIDRPDYVALQKKNLIPRLGWDDEEEGTSDRPTLMSLG